MPFDGLGKLSLLEVGRAIGITPIPLAVLEAHKAAEVKKKRGSFMGRWLENSPGLFVKIVEVTGVLCVAVVFALVMFGVVFSISRLFWSYDNWTAPLVMFGVACGIVPIILVLDGDIEVSFRGQAKWCENRYGSYRRSQFDNMVDIPLAIKGLALTMLEHMPDADIVIGKLFQGRYLLDPYLALEHNGERFVIGIWDGDTIIKIAESD